MTDQTSLLKQYFGHDSFRKGQKPLIDALLSGRDVLGVMPTGAGKSVCYQLPAILLPGITIVVSPLISLMKDQVAALKLSGVSAACINSTLSAEEYADTLAMAAQGVYKLLYVAPERLLTGGFSRLAQASQIALIAVDEAHCVSQWGQDFRPSYLDIARFIESLPHRPVVGAFTATATEAVKADIVRLLGLRDPFSITTGFDRPNLFFDVQTPKDKLAWLMGFLVEHPGESGIVYCATRKGVEQVCAGLIQRGVSATRYHAGLADEERRQNQEDFVYDQRRVMVATNAFGMGIDKSNVSFVIHYNMPKNVESYYQEAGRAGRDGEKARCVLLFSPGDVQTMKFLINASAQNEALTPEAQRNVYLQDMERLRRMTAYCKTNGCYRSFLLNYFGEKAPEHCDACGNCAGQRLETDITVEAQKILSGVARVERKYAKGLGMAVISQMLHGSRERRVLQLGLDGLPTYGVMADTSLDRIRAYVDRLTQLGYLAQTEGDYPVLRLTEAAWAVLRGDERVTFIQRKAPKPVPASRRRKGGRGRALMPTVQEDGLYEALRRLRANLAQRDGVPAYVVFSNATLADMTVKRPQSMTALLQVSGVGEYKAARYGEAFLAVLREWEDK